MSVTRALSKLLQCIFLGAVSSIERNHEEVPMAKAGDEVSRCFIVVNVN